MIKKTVNALIAIALLIGLLSTLTLAQEPVECEEV